MDCDFPQCQITLGTVKSMPNLARRLTERNPARGTQVQAIWRCDLMDCGFDGRVISLTFPKNIRDYALDDCSPPLSFIETDKKESNNWPIFDEYMSLMPVPLVQAQSAIR